MGHSHPISEQLWQPGVHYYASHSNLPGLIISCGIHGNETGPIDCAEQLRAKLKSENIPCERPILFIYANLEAIKIKKRYLDFNMNRLFNLPNKPSRNLMLSGEYQRSIVLENMCKRFAKLNPNGFMHLDLHSTIKPSIHNNFILQPITSRRYALGWSSLVEAAQITAWVQQTKHSNTFSQFTHDVFNAESVTLEYGDLKSENHAYLFQALINLITRKELNSRSIVLKHYQVETEIIKQSDSFRFVIDESKPNFFNIQKAETICIDAIQKNVAKQNLYSLFLNSRVPVGQRAGLALTELNNAEGIFNNS